MNTAHKTRITDIAASSRATLQALNALITTTGTENDPAYWELRRVVGSLDTATRIIEEIAAKAKTPETQIVVLNHSISSTHIASLHREGCSAIEREARTHASSVYGPYTGVDEAMDAYMDDEMREMGYTTADVKVHSCCR